MVLESLVCIVSLMFPPLAVLVSKNSMTANACAPVLLFSFDVAGDQAASATDLAPGSSTHASRANQRWLALQCGQYASAKRTGEQLNLRRSASMPVEIVFPVAGH